MAMLRNPRLVKLTDKEQEVIRHIAYGHSTSQIAKGMHLSIDTIKTHLQRIYLKTGMRTRGGAAIYCILYNLIDVDLVKRNYDRLSGAETASDEDRNH